jgi:predicted NBD/HSP70 family sugar kinase
MIAIGVDVGGTYTRVGAIEIKGTCGRELAIRCCATIGDDDGNALIDWMVQAVDEVVEEAAAGRPSPIDAVDGQDARVAGVGLALPGILDRDRRELVRSVNVPFLQNRPIGDELSRRTGYRVRLATDAEAATWAEYVAWTARAPYVDEDPRPGAPGKPAARSFVHLRIGTGIGCGLVVYGELKRLDANRSGHLDVLVVEDGPDAPVCPCGKRGCLETVASGRVLHDRAVKVGYMSGLPNLQRGWERGDTAAQAIVHKAASALAAALANTIERFSPEVISIGGGVLSALPCLLDEARRRVSSGRGPSSNRSSITILPAIHGDGAGAIGVVLLACPTRSATV